MALGSHLITVRRLEKYINDVIGKKANLPDTSKTIIGNISQINTDLSDLLSSNLTVLYNDTPKNILGGTNITITDDFSKYRTLYVVMSSANTDITQLNVSVTTISTSLLKWYYDNISNARSLSINATTNGSALVGTPAKYVDERTIYMQTNSSSTGNIFVHRILGSKL
jgi:hypothetical protein